jgi:hypothetical protein
MGEQRVCRSEGAGFGRNVTIGLAREEERDSRRQSSFFGVDRDS